ncbi:Ig-like domain-containing protein [Hymenobacter sp. M29]|uniref:Ig-like domain-containing protein n=1 Tax=Hymenobacter mellowenesis TaxID=3063995 RepID=A0ABT9A8K2_9BACT|nr:Ig-like domain-containing protein [Hymenobacter sp. M29]MDO7846166.1 Ig-like domain-containing protein [Hymenobacter sp. M29]
MRLTLQRLLLLLLLPLGMALGARAQLPYTEDFNSDGEAASPARYTTNTASLNTSAVPFANGHYFFRATTNPPQIGGTNVFGTSTTTGFIYSSGTTAAPTGFWAFEGVRSSNEGTSSDQVPAGLLTLKALDVTNYTNLKVSIKFADARGAGYGSYRGVNTVNKQAEVDDKIRIQYSMDAGATWTNLGVFTGANSAAPTYWTAASPTTEVALAGGTELTATFQTFTYDITETGTSLRVRVVADERGGQEELAFDDITVTGMAGAAPPKVENIETGDISYTEGDPSVKVTDNLTVTYASNLSGATVAINSGYRSMQDVLSFTIPTGSSISCTSCGTGANATTSTTGTLTLTGTGTAAQYQQALLSVRYLNSNTTNATGGRRVIRFTVADGSTNSSAQTRAVVVTPILAGPAAMPYTEDFESDGEGTRYSTNTFATTGTNAGALGWFRTSLASPADYSASTFTNISGTSYWYGEGTNNANNPDPALIGFLETQTIDARSYVNLHYQVRLAQGKATQWETDDFIKFYYRVGSSGWVQFGAFYGNGSPGNLQRDANNDGVADSGGTILNNGLTNIDFTLPATLSGIIDFRTVLSSDGDEEMAMDLIQVTGTQQTTVNSIVRASANPTNAATVNYTVTFGAAVTGLTASNFSLTTTGLGGTPTVGTPTQGSGNTWTVPVTTGTGSGTLTLNLANDTNLSYDISTTLPFAGDTYNIDKTAPAAPVVTVPANGSAVNSTTPTISGTAETGSTVTVREGTTVLGTVTATGGSWSLTSATLGQGSHTIAATATDAAGNASTASASVTFTVDTAAPTVSSINRQTPAAATTNATSLTFRVTFSENVTGVDATDFTFITTSGSVSSTGKTVVTVTANSVYDVTVSGVSGTGAVRLDLNASNSGIVDAAGNALSGYITGSTYTIDQTAPTVTSFSSSTGASGSTTTATTFDFSVVFSEAVTGFASTGITVTNGSVTSGPTGSGTGAYTFTVTPTTAGTATTVRIAANAAQDAVGNNSQASASTYSLTLQQPLVATSRSVTVNLAADGTGTLSASSVNNNSTGPGTLIYTIQKIVYGRIPERAAPLTLTTPNGANFTSIRFASYGTPIDNGNGNYSLGPCNAANSLAAAQNAYVGRSSGDMYASNTDTRNSPILGDPCGGTSKFLAVQAAYSPDAASLTYNCTEAGQTQYVLLTVSNGSSTSTSVAQVTVNPSPTISISSVSPNPAQRGATITVSGSNLSGIGSTVTVNGASATVSGLSASGFTFVVPNTATIGAGNLTLTAPCSQTLNTAFTVTAPTVVSVTRLTPSPTATAQVRYQVVFSGSVSGVTVSNFTTTTTGSVTLSGTGVSSTSGSGTTYIVTVNTGTGDGTLTLNVANSTGITPTVSNVPYTAGETYTITKSFVAAPTLRIQAAGSASGNGDVTAFVDVVQVLQSGTSTVVPNGLQNGSFEANNVPANGFKKTVDGVVAAPWSFTGTSGVARYGSAFDSQVPSQPQPLPPNGDAVALIQSAGNNNASISQNLAVPTGSYQVNFQTAQRYYTSVDQRLNVFVNDVFVGSIQTSQTPAYEPFTSASFNVFAPALIATVSTTSASPTSTAPIPFAVSFTDGTNPQSVGTTFTASDVTVSGGTLNAASFSGSGAGPYTFTVTPSGAGTVTVSVAANLANDANNTQNSASNSVSVQYNQPATAAPVITAPTNNSFTNQPVTIAGTAPANSAVVLYSSVNNGAFQAGTPFNASASGTFSLGPATVPDGVYQVYATAQSPNSSVSPNSPTITFTVDTSRPSVVITSSAGASGGSTATTPIPFSVTFSETVNGSFVQGDLSVSGGTIVTGSFSGSGAGPYTFTVTPTGLGSTVSVNVVANVAQDAAGNFNTAAPAAYTLRYAPALSATVSTTSGSPTSTSPIPFRVDFSQSVGSTFVASDVTVSGGTVNAASFSGSGAGPYTFTVTPSTTSSTVTVSLAANVAQDAATTGNTASNSVSVQFQAPTIVVAPASLPGGTQGVAYSATFSTSGGSGTYTYALTGTPIPGLTLTGATLSGTPTASGSYTFTITATDNSAAPGAYSGSRSYTVTIAAPTSVAWNGNVNTDWFNANNWSPNQVPDATTDAIVPTSPSGGRFPVIAANAAQANARNVSIASGATLSMSANTLIIAANLTNNGSFNGFTGSGGSANGGTVALGGSAAATIGGTGTARFWNLTVGTNGTQSTLTGGASVQRVLTLNGNLTAGQPFTLVSDANGTAMVVNNGSAVVTGNLTVQRYIVPDLNPNLGYRHFSAPISTATVGSLATGSFSPVVNPAYNGSATPTLVVPFPTIYGYDQSRLATTTNNLLAFDKGWFSPNATSDPLTVGQGYTVNLAANQTFSLTGPQNNGNVPLNFSRNAGTPTDQAGWQLIGNPYPSPLDWSQVQDTERPGLDRAMYVFASNNPSNPYVGTYGFYNNGVGNISPVLPLGQGFFVRVTAGQTAASLTFKNTHRVTTYANPTYHRNAAETRPLVQLTLRSAAAGTNSDEAFVYFENGATAGVDSQFDAVKLPNSTGLNLASFATGQQLAINGLPTGNATTVTVPLFIGLPATGTYTLNATQVLNFSAGAQPFLRDLQLGTLTDLSVNPTYTFTMNAANTTPRFELVFGPQAVLSTASAALAAQVAVFPNPATKAVFVELPASLRRTAATVALVDAVGRVVRTQALPAGLPTHTLPLTDVATGVYSLRLQTSAGVVVKKLVVE